ncbi:MAG: carbohydrate-binding protein [Gammaproteobacteria bacterium]|nr:carbohydrate-binding protein [Gammaproteobacteria bacterium]MBU1655613.1 carbohydrate-binding protein [Gammaproteobacteria bacterium]MBU1962285.1 carbohydrate-binding protein [Gammaproteobacteria bacterium]
MRKTIIDPNPPSATIPQREWLDLEHLARVELTSEQAEHPIENALVFDAEGGWRAAGPGEQCLRLLFDQPRAVHWIHLVFTEQARQRTQEFVLKGSTDGGLSYRDILRQQFHFSPPETSREVEDYRVDLPGVNAIELRITPDISGGEALASLDRLRIG